MPFIVDLPPIDFPDDNTKIESLSLNGQKKSPEFDFDTFRIDEDLFENVYFKEKFNSLHHSWKNKTMFQSSISKIIEDKNFSEILKMNKKILLPLIIDEIEKEPSVLVWALNILSGQSLIIKQRHTIEDVCRKWVKLYRQGKIQIT